MSKVSLSDLGLPELRSEDDRGAYSAATARITAYWTDECARNLDKLMTHFTADAEVITPDGHDAVASLYRKSFGDYPGLRVDVKAGFAGRGAHCFEYSALLSDAASNRWLVEGINLMKLEHGLISSLRSFEDAPRRLSAAGGPR